jgi:hypothetical protein
VSIRVGLRAEWAGPGGLLGGHPRVRTLRKVLVSYPDVRHILPDCIRLDAQADARTLASVTRFLERQQWLVTSVTTVTE